MEHLPSDERTDLLRRARALHEGHDDAGVVALLDGRDEASLVGEPELGFLLATSLRRTGAGDRALALTQALAPALARRGRDRLALLRLNLEAALHFDRGVLSAAEQGWRLLVAGASEAADDELLARANNNLGIVYTLQSRLDEALVSYNRALAAHQRRGDRAGMAQAHANLAIAYRELGFHLDADSHFIAAIEHARAAGVEAVVGRAEEERALVFLLNGDAPLAEATAARALARFRRIGDRAGAGESLRVLGLVALADDRVAEARARLDEALTVARELGAALLEAETLEARAVVTPDPAEPRARAETLFAAMGAEAWGRQVRARVVALSGG